MILSEERVSHIAHLLVDTIGWKNDWVDFRDEGKALRIAKHVITDFCASYDRAIATAREKLDRQKNVVPGSQQWDILLEKYVQEELRKKGFSAQG